MHAVNLITSGLKKTGAKLPEFPCDPVMQQCALTGEYTECIPLKKVISNNSTTWDLLSNPSGQYVCTDAYIAWMYAYKARADAKKAKKPEMQSSWIASSDGFFELNRIQVRDGRN